LRTYVGRGAGAFIENQFFAAPKTTFLSVALAFILAVVALIKKKN